MSAKQKVTSVELLGGPHDGLIISRDSLHAPGNDWPREVRIHRYHGSMIGPDGHIVAASVLSRTDVYVRCGFARYRYKETRR